MPTERSKVLHRVSEADRSMCLQVGRLVASSPHFSLIAFRNTHARWKIENNRLRGLVLALMKHHLFFVFLEVFSCFSDIHEELVNSFYVFDCYPFMFHCPSILRGQT